VSKYSPRLYSALLIPIFLISNNFTFIVLNIVVSVYDLRLEIYIQNCVDALQDQQIYRVAQK